MGAEVEVSPLMKTMCAKLSFLDVPASAKQVSVTRWRSNF